MGVRKQLGPKVRVQALYLLQPCHSQCVPALSRAASQEALSSWLGPFLTSDSSSGTLKGGSPSKGGINARMDPIFSHGYIQVLAHSGGGLK